MENIKFWLSKRSIVIKVRLILELIDEYFILAKHLGAIKLEKTKAKMEADLEIRSHAIEKGLSFESPRIGFGEKKVEALLNLMGEYMNRYGESLCIHKCMSVMLAYFDFNDSNGHVNRKLKERYLKIFQLLKDQNKKCEGGVKSLKKEDINDAIEFDFKRFVNSRYSIRDFSNVEIPIELIYKALDISKKAPSACNRQSWRVHVFKDGKSKREILKWQGNKGFIENIDTAIIISGSLNSYFVHERHQVYVDGGLYAMTLMFALHSLGLGTIPLTMALMSSKSNELYSKFEIPKDEVPVVMIGVGNLKDHFNVAISKRNSINEYVKFH